jgi:hypothetical protein
VRTLTLSLHADHTCQQRQRQLSSMIIHVRVSVLGLMLLVPPAERASVPECVDSTGMRSSFEFASNPWLNLYNFLFKTAKQRRGIEDDGLGARGYVTDDTAALRPLMPAEQRDWNAAVDLFARVVISDGMGIDSLVLNVNDVLARLSPDDSLGAVRLHPEIRRALTSVMPIYRSAWWPVHHRRNQEWIAAMRERLAEREACLVRRATSVFRAPWPAAPLHVDAAVYASWFGAYSTRPPTRITVAANARGSQGSYGLEVLLHEAAHGMLAPLDSALTARAERRKKALPPELSHLVLFYTAGALMREQDPAYTPFAEEFGVWKQNRLTRRYHDVIQRAWQPYLSGTRSFDDAIGALIDGVP